MSKESESELYKNRDMMLGEIHSSIKNTEKTLVDINSWCKEHDKRDERRFMIVGVSIIAVAVATGSMPALLKIFHVS